MIGNLVYFVYVFVEMDVWELIYVVNNVGEVGFSGGWLFRNG